MALVREYQTKKTPRRKEAREEIKTLDFLKSLNGQWLPLLGKHSDADIRLLFQKNLGFFFQIKLIFGLAIPN